MGGLLEVIDEMVLVDRGGLPFEVLAETYLEVDQAIDRLQRLRMVLLERIDRSGAAAAEEGSTAAWSRAVGNCSPTAAARDVHVARDLADVMPAVRDRLCAGGISLEHARIAAGMRRDLTDGVVRDADASLADAAAACTPAEFREFVTGLRHSLRPDSLAGDERTAFEQRRLDAATTFGGIGVGDWTLDPVSQEMVMTAIHAASAPTGATDERTAAQRRADGLITVAQFFNDHHQDPGGGKKALPHLLVHVRLDTLIAHAGAPAATTGYGRSISGEAVRRLGCEAGVTRIVFGPDNELINVGRTNRLFTPAARKGIIARDRHCRWPGCSAPAAWCEAHHITHWIDGGPSNPENGVLLCGRHHDRVHHHRHAIVINPDGTRTVHRHRDSAAPDPLIDHRNRAGP